MVMWNSEANALQIYVWDKIYELFCVSHMWGITFAICTAQSYLFLQKVDAREGKYRLHKALLSYGEKSLRNEVKSFHFIC